MFQHWQDYLLKTTTIALLFSLIQGCSSQKVLAECVPSSFPANWLQTQERLGGHTIARHVGRSDQQLVERLNRDDRIRSSSSYYDIKTASNNIQTALSSNRNMLNNWANNAALGQKQVIDYSANSSVGRIAFRPASLNNIRNSSKFRVVLTATSGDSCYVLTSYPVE